MSFIRVPGVQVKVLTGGQLVRVRGETGPGREHFLDLDGQEALLQRRFGSDLAEVEVNPPRVLRGVSGDESRVDGAPVPLVIVGQLPAVKRMAVGDRDVELFRQTVAEGRGDFRRDLGGAGDRRVLFGGLRPPDVAETFPVVVAGGPRVGQTEGGDCSSMMRELKDREENWEKVEEKINSTLISELSLLWKKAPIPIADLILPSSPSPASVTPKCKGKLYPSSFILSTKMDVFYKFFKLSLGVLYQINKSLTTH